MRRLGAVLTIVAMLAPAAPAHAFDLESEYARRTLILGLLVGGGEQNNVEGHDRLSNVTFVNGGYRVTLLPFDPLGVGWYRGAFEAGFEGWFQYYVHPAAETAQGGKLALRYNFLGTGGRLVPYVEALGGVGGTSLKVDEINSTVAFVLEAGVGVQYFVASRTALHVGYRFQHISNGNVKVPNRGFNSDTGVIGVSFFFR